MRTISIDFGGSRVKMGVVEDGRIIEKAVFRSHSEDGLSRLLPQLEPTVSAWCAYYHAEKLGIAFPSIVDAAEKRILCASGKFNDGQNTDLQRWARGKFGLPMILDNDANAAAIGEHAYGAAKDCDDFVLMILGTGIGTAAMMNGRLIRGKHFQAGVLMGHIPLKVHGRRCAACGAGEGCAEAQASTWALSHIVRESEIDSPLKSEPKINFEVLQHWYERGDRLAQSVFEECCAYWSNLLIAMICAYDPELIVLSGGVMNWGNELIRKLENEVSRRVWTPWGKPAIAAAKDPESSVLLGLHALCSDTWSDENRDRRENMIF